MDLEISTSPPLHPHFPSEIVHNSVSEPPNFPHNPLGNGFCLVSTNNGHNSASSTDQTGSDRWRTLVLSYKTLGVVFGGLVTSPLYVYPSMKFKHSPVKEDYLGIYSIMFWTLTLTGVVKYTCIALKADDHGEGGTFAMYSLLCKNTNISHLSSNHSYRDASHHSKNIGTERHAKLVKFVEKSVVARRVLLFIAMLGTCMLIGDGILTPAITVLSAMDGLKARFDSISKTFVEALSAVVLIALFLVQKFGTSRVSFLFSPIMAAWTFTTPMIGTYSILCHYPSIFKALSPHYIINFFLRNGKEGWLLLGGTVLCITGAEAMFADLGHFNKKSIQMAFLFTIYPSLVLTYAGQTAYLIKNPNDHADGFFKFVPKPVYWPMFIIATLAATVASQSLISATFSLIKQSVALDYFPRVKVVHTSDSKEGEVYCPDINYILMVLCVGVILGFRDSQDLGNAFGVVVIFVMLITTVLLTLVMVMIWKTPLFLAGLYFVTFFILEGVYMSAVFTKIPEGGWVPFAISVILALIMFGWYYGRQRKIEYDMTHMITLDSLPRLLSNKEIQRVPGFCFFYSNIQTGLRPSIAHYVKNMQSLHQVTIFTSLRYSFVARVSLNERIVMTRLGFKGIYGCVIQYGYADSFLLNGDEFINQVFDSLRAHIQNSFDGLSSLSMSVEEEVSELEQAKRAGFVHVLGKMRSALPALDIPVSQRMEVVMLYEA